MSAPLSQEDNERLIELYETSKRDLRSGSPSFASKMLVWLYEQREILRLSKNILHEEKCMLSFQLDIAQTRMAKLVKSGDTLIAALNEKEK